MADAARIYLGIEGGGTRTTAIVADEKLQSLGRREFGPANLRLLTDSDLESRLREVAAFCPAPAAIGIGLAGTRDETDRKRIQYMAGRVWGDVPCVVTHDLEIALHAADEHPGAEAKILVLSGTGSCCYGRSRNGSETKLGGWGHLLGDKGSGFDIGISAAKAAIYEFDRHGRWGTLGQCILRCLLLNKPDDLIDWVRRAEKAEVSALAISVFEAAAEKDNIARQVLDAAAESLALDAVLCARRMVKRRARVTFHLAGSVLLKQSAFARQVARRIRAAWPSAIVAPLTREGAWGAVKLAAAAASRNTAGPVTLKPAFYFPDFVPGTSPTEQRNPRSSRFDRLSIPQAMALMLSEEETVAAALRKEKNAIGRAVRFCSEALKNDGRIFYAGAGTSGRLGVLDASECPPTFRASPEMVQGIMAGGQRALWQAVEGAEDNAGAGAESVHFRGVCTHDVLIGIAASGRTPFVWGALAAAKAAGAQTILLHFNPSLEIKRGERPNVVIAPNLGPEVLTGSTRLKCGTATKLVLNMISTISMVRLGKVVSNLMVDLNPSNVKLRDRAVRIVQALTGSEASDARDALERNGWVIKKALTALGKNRG